MKVFIHLLVEFPYPFDHLPFVVVCGRYLGVYVFLNDAYQVILKDLMLGALCGTVHEIDERDSEGEYFKIGSAIDQETFEKLNKVTKLKGTDAKNLNVILKNYEDELIDAEEAAECLDLFNRHLTDFGIEPEQFDSDGED